MPPVPSFFSPSSLPSFLPPFSFPALVSPFQVKHVFVPTGTPFDSTTMAPLLATLPLEVSLPP